MASNTFKVPSALISKSSRGLVTGASVSLADTLDAAYRNNHAADAVVETTGFDAGAMDAAARVSGVRLVEARRVVHARLLRGTEDWRNVDLIAVPDYGRVELNRFFPQTGAWPPPDQAVLL